MTPAARLDAAIIILDEIIGGAPAERSLTGWGRRSRFAGSKDRAAVRDLVFGALRCRRSYGWLGGGDTGRALVLGLTKAAGDAPDALFTGARYAPAPLSDAERSLPDTLEDAPRGVALDVPDWLLARFDASLGDETDNVLGALRARAPVTLRVNLAKTSRDEMVAQLCADGFDARPHPGAKAAVAIGGAPRGLARHAGYETGLFEFQDASSQAAVEVFGDLIDGARALDFCAGGGGKSLAVAALGAVSVTAHDALPRRMADLPARAARAGAKVDISASPKGPFDLVMCDVPCSGSGAWRRQPDAKWRLTPEALQELCGTQSVILDAAMPLVRPGGHLVYMTCSLLGEENADQVDAALSRHTNLTFTKSRTFSPLQGGDGFYVAVLNRKTI